MTERVLVAFKIDKDADRRMRIEAARRAISKSEALRQAAGLWLDTIQCPACDGDTIVKDGVVYCVECGLKVAPVDGQE